MTTTHIYLADTPEKGRGVFASVALPCDTIVETAPVIVMSAEDRILLDKTLLHDYIFEWQPEGANMCCMALGWVPLYNHSYTANCEYFMDYNEKSMYIQTMRDIEPGEELTINYNGPWNDSEKVWFDVK